MKAAKCYYRVSYGDIVSTSKLFATNITIANYRYHKDFAKEVDAKEFAQKVNGKVEMMIALF